MVLTNIELWAADGSTGTSMPLDFETSNPHVRHINPFDPRVVPQLNSNLNHLSSNGYYGFSYVNAAHNIEVNNDNDVNISNININNNNNNNTTTCNLMSNDVNGINNTNATLQQTYAFSAGFGGSAYAVDHAANVVRCKKRYLVMSDDDVISDCTSTKNYYGNNSEVAAKRCRFDDDFSAQYFNDFFQLPSTQIATQSCLMDTEEGLQPQQQVNVAMLEGNNNNIEKYEQKLNPQLSDLSAQQHEQNSQQIQQLEQQQQVEPQQQQQELPQQYLYHQQQHYQGHLHRANRDVSRCMLSHMI